MEKPVIFFDGVCGLCNGFVDFVMKYDKTNIFFFSPLQSEFAKNTLPESMTKNLDSIAVRIDGQIYTKSEAVLRVLQKMGGIWKLSTMAFVFPDFLRNSVYDLVARHRYGLFGKKETCRIPTPEERKRFIL